MPYSCAENKTSWLFFLSLFLFCGSYASAGWALHRKREHDTPTQGHDDKTSDVNDAKFQALVSWMRANGGRVDDRIAMDRSSIPITTELEEEKNNQYQHSPYRRVVATYDIPVGTELFFSPWSLVMGTVGDTHNVDPAGHCQTLNEYADHVRAGNTSFWYPYLSLDESLQVRIPTVWHPSAIEELQGLLPDAHQDSLSVWYIANCVSDSTNTTSFKNLDAAAQQALLAAITRSAGMRFLPLFDLLNHDNFQLNTRSDATAEGNTVYAAMDIKEGSEIYNSYRSGASDGDSGTTSEIFRRYGFIEQIPIQQWTWKVTTPRNDTAMQHQEPRHKSFLVLSAEVVVILPPPRIISAIGIIADPPLSELMTRETADHHNRYGVTLEEMAGFLTSGLHLQKSFPTTLAEDEIIVKHLYAEMRGMDINSEDAVLHLQDKISALSYRKAFKQSLQLAVKTAQEIISSTKTMVNDEL